MGARRRRKGGNRYPVEVISRCVWLYFRFPLSSREVEELMLQRGVIVSCETVRRWCRKFGRTCADGLRRRRPRRSDRPGGGPAHGTGPPLRADGRCVRRSAVRNRA